MNDAPRKGSLLVVFLTVFIDLLGFGIVLPLLPIYAQRLTLDPTGVQLGLLMASFSAMQFLFAPLWGRGSDRFGRRPVILVGLAGSVLFYSLFAVATLRASFALLLVSRIGAGVAGATISTAQAYIADTTSLENRTKGMALIGMAFGLGFTLGPLVGYLALVGASDDPGPWPGYVAAGLSSVALVLAWFLLPESLGPASQSAAPKLLDTRALRNAMAIPSVWPLLLAVFVCVFSFANFETTLSILIRGSGEADDPFQFSYRNVFLTFAYIGFVLALVQGVLVRRLAVRVAEGRLAATGAALEIVGFLLIVLATNRSSIGLLLAALAVVVAGFGMLSPTLHSLISRRSDPLQQGGILGVGQSMSSLARILGSAVGIPMLKAHLLLPFFAAAALMAGGLVLIVWASRHGRDFER
jgi:MFS family permease